MRFIEFFIQEENSMFYTILFFLAFYSFGKSVKNFIREHVTVKDGRCVEIPGRAYLSLGLIAAFHVMVLAVCVFASMLFR